MVGEKEAVILVNQNGKAIGRCGKPEAHRKGLLHRAFSVFIFNEQGELLLQKRSRKKYHFGGLWSNSCCSHPQPGENVRSAARRRLQEELGIAVPLKVCGSVKYLFNDMKSGLTEHEFDIVMAGKYSGAIIFPHGEIEEVKWIQVHELRRELRLYPARFTPWLPVTLPLANLCD